MTTLLTHHHVAVSMDEDGTLLIEQVDHSGNREAVCLHTSQLKAVAEFAGLITPSSMPTLPPSLQSRLVRIRDRAIEHHASMVKHSGVRNHDDEFYFYDESAALHIADELKDLLHDYSDQLNLVSADVLTIQNQGDRQHDDHP